MEIKGTHWEELRVKPEDKEMCKSGRVFILTGAYFQIERVFSRNLRQKIFIEHYVLCAQQEIQSHLPNPVLSGLWYCGKGTWSF